MADPQLQRSCHPARICTYILLYHWTYQYCTAMRTIMGLHAYTTQCRMGRLAHAGRSGKSLYKLNRL